METVCMAGQTPLETYHAKCKKENCKKCGHNYNVCLARAITYFVDGMTVGPDGKASLIVPKP